MVEKRPDRFAFHKRCEKYSITRTVSVRKGLLACLVPGPRPYTQQNFLRSVQIAFIARYSSIASRREDATAQISVGNIIFQILVNRYQERVDQEFKDHGQ
jgi:hypothetical protein